LHKEVERAIASILASNDGRPLIGKAANRTCRFLTGGCPVGSLFILAQPKGDSYVSVRDKP
jgi:hypothetical protein